MKLTRFFLLFVLSVAWVGSSPMPATATDAMDATEIVKQSHLNFYYAGDDGVARVTMTITDKKGKTREREFVMLRKDFEEGGVQKYYVFFERPNDVRRMSFMAWKNPEEDDSRWIFIPSLDLVKRLSANDKKSSFVGSDFSYEDVSGRHWSEDSHELVREEEMGGRLSYVIESRPNEKDYFERKVSWIDKERLLPLREEYYTKGDKLDRVFEALKVAEVDGFNTITKRKMSTPRKENHTVVDFSNIEYDAGVPEDVFSERYLKSPPRDYIQ